MGADLAPFVATDATPAQTSIDPADSPRGSIAPLILGAGATVGLAGGAAGPRYVIAGLLLAVVGAGVWAFDNLRTPGVLDPDTATNVDHRFLEPLGLPVVATVAALTIAYSFSRVLLAVNETASWVTAIIVAAIVFAILCLIAARRPATKVVSVMAGIGLVGVLASGGAGAAVGERDYESHKHEVPSVDITAKNIAFDRKVIALPADSEVEIDFTNLDTGTFHNVAVYTAEEPGTPIFNGRPSAHGLQKYAFKTPDAGTYRYVCDFHPSMTGELRLSPASTSEKESEH